MSYYTLKNLCDVYNQSSNALTSNFKYTNPYTKDGKINIYDINTHDINSNYYLQNNFYDCTKSYNNIVNSYPHFLKNIIEKKKQQLEEEKVDKELDEQIKILQNKISKNESDTTENFKIKNI